MPWEAVERKGSDIIKVKVVLGGFQIIFFSESKLRVTFCNIHAFERFLCISMDMLQIGALVLLGRLVEAIILE